MSQEVTTDKMDVEGTPSAPPKGAPPKGAPRRSHVAHRDGGQQRRRDRQTVDIAPKYTDYWTKEQVDQAVAEGRVVLGSFHVVPNKRNIGFVRVPNGVRDVFIDGAEARNRAMDGDYVAVELGPETEQSLLRPTSENLKMDVESNARKLELFVPDLEAEARDALWCPTETTVSQPPVVDDDIAVPRQKQRMGKVVSILAVNSGEAMTAEREFNAQHIGKLEAACVRSLLKPGHHLPSTETFAYFVPSDPRTPRLRIPLGELPYEFTQDPLVHGQQFLYSGKITSWPASQPEPSGVLLGRIGQAGEIGTETQALLVENGVDHGEFPQIALDCLQKFLPPRTAQMDQPGETWWKIPSEEFEKRRDLRSTLIFTVDPYTAKDIDDALHCTPLPNGDYEMGVHIADVSYFVERGSDLDAEAHRRSTTVYLVQKVVPMLPALLSGELCSLNPNVDRLAYSCIWRMRPSGELVPDHAPWFGRTIIRSACKLHYGLAQRIIDEGPAVSDWEEAGRVPEQSKWTKEQVCESLRNMHVIGMSRRKLRFDPQRGGALEMQTVKMSFELDPQTGNPSGVKKYPMHDTNRLVEEFMLLANFLVAQRLIVGDRQNAFLRHHPPPDAKEMQKMVEVLQRSCGVTLFENGKISPSAIHEALKMLRASAAAASATNGDGEDSTARDNNLLIVASELLKKPMKNAQYFVASDLEEFNWRHWALNIKYYTHFTSPIRRYADVCVHRMLTKVLDSAAPALTPDEKIFQRYAAERCNEKKDASRHAQEASDELYLNLLLRDMHAKETPLSTQGIVIELGPKSFTLLLPELGISKRVHAMDDFKWVVLSAETLNGKDVAGKASDDNDGGVISLTLQDPKAPATAMHVKVLSEFRVLLIPKQQSLGRRDNGGGGGGGGMDFKLVPQKGAPMTGVTLVDAAVALAAAAQTEGGDAKTKRPLHLAHHRRSAQGGATSAATSYQAPKSRPHGKKLSTADGAAAVGKEGSRAGERKPLRQEHHHRHPPPLQGRETTTLPGGASRGPPRPLLPRVDDVAQPPPRRQHHHQANHPGSVSHRQQPSNRDDPPREGEDGDSHRARPHYQRPRGGGGQMEGGHARIPATARPAPSARVVSDGAISQSQSQHLQQQHPRPRPPKRVPDGRVAVNGVENGAVSAMPGVPRKPRGDKGGGDLMKD